MIEQEVYLGELPHHHRQRHVHHQRRRARDRVASSTARPACSSTRSTPPERQAAVHGAHHPVPRLVGGVQPRRQRHHARAHRPQAEAPGDGAAAARWGSSRTARSSSSSSRRRRRRSEARDRKKEPRRSGAICGRGRRGRDDRRGARSRRTTSITPEQVEGLTKAGFTTLRTCSSSRTADEADIVRNTLRKDSTQDRRKRRCTRIYNLLRPGEPPRADTAREILNKLFFNPKRYDLAQGRPLQAEPEAAARCRSRSKEKRKRLGLGVPTTARRRSAARTSSSSSGT